MPTHESSYYRGHSDVSLLEAKEINLGETKYVDNLGLGLVASRTVRTFIFVDQVCGVLLGYSCQTNANTQTQIYCHFLPYFDI